MWTVVQLNYSDYENISREKLDKVSLMEDTNRNPGYEEAKAV